MRSVSSRLVLAAALTVFTAGPATAQAVGNYSGAAADGSTVQFTVATDSLTGQPELTGALIFFNTVCPAGDPPANFGVGFGPNVDFTNGKLTYASGLPTGTYLAFNLTFDATSNTLKGFTTTVVSQLAAVRGTPRKAYACISAKQALTATLQPGAATSHLSGVKSSDLVYDSHGRVIGTIHH